jgi:hypothetical protein
MAKCNAVDIPQRMRVLDYLMTCFQTEDKTFELASVLDFLQAPSVPDVVALTSAVLHTGWFNEIVANEFQKLGPGGVSSLSQLFGVPSPITKAVFVNVGASKTERTLHLSPSPVVSGHNSGSDRVLLPSLCRDDCDRLNDSLSRLRLFERWGLRCGRLRCGLRPVVVWYGMGRGLLRCGAI